DPGSSGLRTQRDFQSLCLIRSLASLLPSSLSAFCFGGLTGMIPPDPIILCHPPQ
ncbi:hypothetical protein FRC14_008168, partial [Serendipita sp. 396]